MKMRSQWSSVGLKSNMTEVLIRHRGEAMTKAEIGVVHPQAKDGPADT